MRVFFFTNVFTHEQQPSKSIEQKDECLLKKLGKLKGWVGMPTWPP